MKRLCLYLLISFGLAVSVLAHAQQTVTLGKATEALTGPWKFHIGDSPRVQGTNTPLWAQPDYNDSTWGSMDLAPPPGSYDPLVNTAGYVPGWTARGYKGHAGYAWYRLRVNVQGDRTGLALKMPSNFDDAYQVYVNGKLIGHFGRFTAHGVEVANALPRTFPLSSDIGNGSTVIAIRMWMDPFTALVDQDAGGLHGAPVLARASAAAALLQLDWDARNRSTYSYFFEVGILLLALLVAFGLFALDRSEPAYLWLGLTCVAILAYNACLIVARYSPVIGSSMFLIADAILTPLSLGLWVLFWAYWFRIGRMAPWHRIVWILVVLLGISTAMLRGPFYGRVVPVHSAVWLTPLTLTLKMLLGVLLVWVTVRGIRRDKVEGWLALPAVVLVILAQYQEELIVLHVPSIYSVFRIGFSLTMIATVLSLLILTVLLLRRFLRGQRERERWKQEIEQARQLQQMLIPEALPEIPGFSLESEYRPSQQVGGDFFQFIRHPSDGSVLIVLGDVTGHGLQAAMLVSLIVGAIRSTAQFDPNPLTMLQSMNRRLIGRAHAQATCLALRVAPDGAVTLANAGHLPPYLNGKEMPMEGALPLGLLESAEFSEMRFQLQPGDRLTLLTDGVVEAQNSQKELFGFARTHEMMQQEKSAVEIAAAAQSFGQEDDITVLRLVWAAIPSEQHASESAFVAAPSAS